MGRKIFVSYKYADENVYDISSGSSICTVRDYVDELEKLLSKEHIYKGESDEEDLSSLSEDMIWEKLKNRIYDSTLTIVMISPNMKISYQADKLQWIPWEISYSLKEISRKNTNGDSVTSKTNAMLAVVVPDINNSYDYFVKENNCCKSNCYTLEIHTLFQILKRNMFNLKNPDTRICDSRSEVYSGESCYIKTVIWEDFESSFDTYIDKAYEIQENIDYYKIELNID